MLLPWYSPHGYLFSIVSIYNSMNHHIYHLRNTRMDDKLQAQLSGIIAAYKPHSEPPSIDEMDTDRVDKSHCSMVDLCQQIGVDYREVQRQNRTKDR